MTLTPCSDDSAAAWLMTSAWPWNRLVTFGPEGFEAYARLRFLPDPAYEGQRESDAEAVPSLSELSQLQIAMASLSAHTQTPDDCYFAWWDGWVTEVAGYSTAALEGSRFELPHRSYFLLRGTLADLQGAVSEPVPSFVWPADHAWCVARDVDPHWAGIGATSAAIEVLRADPSLDVVLADPEVSQPAYS